MRLSALQLVLALQLHPQKVLQFGEKSACAECPHNETWNVTLQFSAVFRLQRVNMQELLDEPQLLRVETQGELFLRWGWESHILHFCQHKKNTWLSSRDLTIHYTPRIGP